MLMYVTTEIQCLQLSIIDMCIKISARKYYLAGECVLSMWRRGDTRTVVAQTRVRARTIIRYLCHWLDFLSYVEGNIRTDS